MTKRTKRKAGSPDNLIKAGQIELTEEALSGVQGGLVNGGNLKLGATTGSATSGGTVSGISTASGGGNFST